MYACVVESRVSTVLTLDTRHSEVVHTRVRLEGGEWRVEATPRSFATVNRLVQSLRLTPLARPLPLPVRVTLEACGESEPRRVFASHRWSAAELRAHVLAHYAPADAPPASALRLFERTAGDDGALVPLDDDATFELEELPLADLVLARRSPYAQLPGRKLEPQSKAAVEVDVPVYDRIPALPADLGSSAGSAAAALSAADAHSKLPASLPAAQSGSSHSSTADSSTAKDQSGQTSERPPLPDKSGVDLDLLDMPPKKQAPRRDSVLVPPISAPKESEDISDFTDSDRSTPVSPRHDNDGGEPSGPMSAVEAAARARARASSAFSRSNAPIAAAAPSAATESALADTAARQSSSDSKQASNDSDTRESSVRVVSGRFFDDLLNDLDELEFEEAAAKRESGQFAAVAGFDSLGNELLNAELDIDERTIASKKLQTMFDLIDDEEEAMAEM